ESSAPTASQLPSVHLFVRSFRLPPDSHADKKMQALCPLSLRRKLDNNMEPDRQPIAPIGSASRRRFVLTMIVAVLLTGGMSLVYWLAAKRAEADADRVSHTYAVRQELETTIRHLTDVESGARG